MLEVIISFDYEIFFGDNKAGIDSILFEPTKKIFDILDNENIKVTFFIDTLSYMKNLEVGNIVYCQKFKNQCVEMLKRGHDIQLHLHGHWLTAEYNKEIKTWINDYRKYKIQEYDDNEIRSAVKNGIKFLKECAILANVEYECLAFRAGGLTLQPESKLIEILLSYGIKYDSSVARYTYSKYDYADYDYRDVPKTLNWKISSEEGVNVDSKKEKSLFEIPVATVKNNLFRLALVKGPLRVTNTNIGGSSFKRPVTKQTKFEKMMKKLNGYNWVTLDTRSANVILSDLNSIFREYKCDKKNYIITIIGHPKMSSTKNMENISKLIKLIKNNEDKFKFVTFKNVKIKMEKNV